MLVASVARAQKPTPIGDSEGTLAEAGLRVVVHISQSAEDSLIGTIDSPDQSSFGTPLSKVTYQAPAVHLEVAAFGGWRRHRFVMSANGRSGKPKAHGQENTDRGYQLVGRRCVSPGRRVAGRQTRHPIVAPVSSPANGEPSQRPVSLPSGQGRLSPATRRRCGQRRYISFRATSRRHHKTMSAPPAIYHDCETRASGPPSTCLATFDPPNLRSCESSYQQHRPARSICRRSRPASR